MSESWAQVRGIDKTYGRGATLVRALSGVDLAVRRGEVTMVIGPSGSGKTTLLQVMGLLQRADRGQVQIAGRRMDRLAESQLPRERRRHVGFIFQEFNLIESLTVRDNVAVGAWLGRDGGNGRRSRPAGAVVDECLKQVGLGPRWAHRPPELSGGEKQRVGVARALACPGHLVLADEPTANLDWQGAVQIMQCLVTLARQASKAVVFVSHDLRLQRFADRIVELADGRVVRAGRPRAHPDAQSYEMDRPAELVETDQPSVAAAPPGDAVDDDVGAAGSPVRRGRWGAVVGLVILLAVVSTAFWVAWPAGIFSSGGGPAATPVTESVAGRDYVAAAPAVVEPVTQLIALRSERPGRIKAILKTAGDRVAAGEPVVLLEDATTRALVEVRRADLQWAEANLAELRAWHRPERRAQAKARLDRAQARLDRARREFRRIEALHQEASASNTEFDEANEDLRLAEAEREEAFQAYQLAQAGPTAEEVAVADRRVGQARAALQLATAEMDLLTIRSPIDGHVIYRHQEPGEIVDIESERPIMSLGNLDEIRLRAEVDESDIRRVKLDQAVVATADALGDRELRGRVVHMEPIMGRKTIRTQRTTERQDTKVREVLIELDPDHPPLPIDLQMTVRFLGSGEVTESQRTTPDR